MNTIIGLMALVLVPLYVVRLNAGHIRHDPLWQSLGNFSGFVMTVLSGGGALRAEAEPLHLALGVVAMVWLMATHYYATEVTMANAIVNRE